MSHDTVIDRYLDPISVRKSDVTNERTRDELLWLQTSPEFGMKRLLAAGADSIYQITRAFRAAEAGARHNPEFTMLEWYRVGDSMQAAINFLAEFAESILKRTQTTKITYRDAFQQFANLDPFTASLDEFQTIVKHNKIELDSITAERFDRDGWLNLILGCIVEPCLGVGQPTIVYDWPASQAALAVVREEEFPVAERFELYVDGFELANGYHELLDPQELEQRNRIDEPTASCRWQASFTGKKSSSRRDAQWITGLFRRGTRRRPLNHDCFGSQFDRGSHRVSDWNCVVYFGQ